MESEIEPATAKPEICDDRSDSPLWLYTSEPIMLGFRTGGCWIAVLIGILCRVQVDPLAAEDSLRAQQGRGPTSERVEFESFQEP